MEGGFGSDFVGSSGGKLDPGLIMEPVKVQIAVANAQELLQVRGWQGAGWWAEGLRDPSGPVSQLRARVSPQRMTDKCFRKCIGKPGGSLDNSEQVKPGVAGSRAGPGGVASARALT